MGNLSNDLKHALQMFAKNPAFTLTAIAALALGIGSNTAIFSVIDAVLLKPLAYPEPDRMVQFTYGLAGESREITSIPKFHNYQEQTGVFEDVSAYDTNGPGYNLTGIVPEQVHGIHVTQNYFKLFGAPVMLGRTFTAQEDGPNGGHVVVLSYGLWKRKFGGDPHIVGTSISLGGDSYTVLGVLGQQFATDPVADIWLPFQFDPNSVNQANFFLVAGRLKPGVKLAQANAQLKIAADEFQRRYPGAIDPKSVFSARLLQDSIVSDSRSSLYILLGAVGFVLLIACANVANLLLIRATGRKREFAIRAAMGAGRIRIVRQLLTESVLLSMIGGVLGIILGYVGVRALLAISPGDIPRIGENGAGVGIDWRVLVFSLGISLLTGILFGLFPAIGASRPDLNTTLKESSNRSGTGFRQSKTRSLLVVFEVSLALILLIGASLLIRTFIALREVNPGFSTHNVLTMEMSLSGDHFKKGADVGRLITAARERLNAIPGVEASASAADLPLQGGFGMRMEIVGQAPDKKKLPSWMSVSPGYLDAFRIPLLRGRDFSERDGNGAAGVALINEAMAKKYWPKGDPIGQQIILGEGLGPVFAEPARQIIGIVGDTRDRGLDLNPRPLVIVPQAQVTDGLTDLLSGLRPIAWVVRTRSAPHQVAAAVSEQLRQVSGGLPVANIRSMDEVMIHSTARENFNMLLLTIFGASALLLAAIGIYGLMAYSVQQRTQEMGIRMALGADRARIRNLVVWHGMRLALAGVVVGVGAAFALAHFIASLLFGVKAYDPVVFVTVPVILSVVALAAVWLPATRASKFDPMQALRVE